MKAADLKKVLLLLTELYPITEEMEGRHHYVIINDANFLEIGIWVKRQEDIQVQTIWFDDEDEDIEEELRRIRSLYGPNLDVEPETKI